MTPRDIAILRLLAAKGVSADIVVAVVEFMAQANPALTVAAVSRQCPDNVPVVPQNVPDIERRRAYDRDRKRKQRAALRPVPAVPQNVPQVVTTTEKKITDEDYRARATPDPKSGGISPEAMALAEEIAALCNIGPPKDWPVHWCGAARTVQAWFNEGMERGFILAVVRDKLKRMRPGTTAFSINFFSDRLGQKFAELRQTPMLMTIGSQEKAYAANLGRGRPRPARYGPHAHIRAILEREAANSAGGSGPGNSAAAVVELHPLAGQAHDPPRDDGERARGGQSA